MTPLDLPEDCYQFLREGRQLDFEPEMSEAGPVVLRSLDDLELERLPVETYPASFHHEDPERDKEGFYYVLTVPLSTGEYVSEAILL